MKLFLWKLSQDVNNGYDTYSSAVVVSQDPEAARRIHPARYSDTGEAIFAFDQDHADWVDTSGGMSRGEDSWAYPNNVKAVCVGEASSFLVEGDVVVASYHAG